MDERKQKIFDKILSDIPYAKEFDFHLEEMRRGYLRCRINSDEHLKNYYGDIHGGALYSIADTEAGMTVGTCGCLGTTIQGDIQYLKAARNTSYIICEEEVVKEGKNIFVVMFKIYDERDLLLNTGTISFFVVGKADDTEVLEED